MSYYDRDADAFDEPLALFAETWGADAYRPRRVLLPLACAEPGCAAELTLRGFDGRDLLTRQFAAYRAGWRQDAARPGRHCCPIHSGAPQ